MFSLVLRIFGGAMLLFTGSQRVGVGRMDTVINLIVWFSWTSSTVAVYEYTKARAAVRRKATVDPHDVYANLHILSDFTGNISKMVFNFKSFGLV